MDTGEIAFYLQQQSCQGVGVSLHFIKRVVVDIEDSTEIAQQRLALKHIRVIIQFGIGDFVIVIFIVDFTDDFFKDIFQCNQTARAAKLVHKGSGPVRGEGFL